MFRALVLTVVLLAGCRSQTKTEPRIVKLPEPGRVCCENNGAQKTFNRKPWIKTTKDFQVFNQKDQHLILKTFEVHTFEDKPVYYVKKGNELYSSLNSPFFRKKEETLLLTIHKLGPETIVGFIKEFLDWTPSMEENCKLVEIRPGAWQVHPITGKSFNYFHGQHANDFCTMHSSDNHAPGTVFLIKDGIVVIYLHTAFWGGIDINSITYENRG